MDGGLNDGHFVGGALSEEEGAQLHGCFLGEDAANDLGRVGHTGVVQDIAQGAGGTSLGVPGTEDDAVDARGQDGTRAHRAGFESNNEGATSQAPRAQGAGCFAQGDDLGVARGIVMSLATVPPSTDDVAIGVDDDGTDGDVSRFAGAIGQEKGFAHGFAILLIH